MAKSRLSKIITCVCPHIKACLCVVELRFIFKCFIVCSSKYKLNMLVFHESTRDAFDLMWKQSVVSKLELYKISAKVLVCTISFTFLFSLSLDQLFNWTASLFYCFLHEDMKYGIFPHRSDI